MIHEEDDKIYWKDREPNGRQFSLYFSIFLHCLSLLSKGNRQTIINIENIYIFTLLSTFAPGAMLIVQNNKSPDAIFFPLLEIFCLLSRRKDMVSISRKEVGSCATSSRKILSCSALPLWLSWQRIHLQFRRPMFDP